MAGGDPGGHRQAGLTVRIKVVKMNGITVNGGIVVGRHVAGRNNIFAKNPVQTLAQGHRRHPGDRPDLTVQQGQGLIQGHQFIADGEAIVLKLRHRLLSFQSRSNPG